MSATSTKFVSRAGTQLDLFSKELQRQQPGVGHPLSNGPASTSSSLPSEPSRRSSVLSASRVPTDTQKLGTLEGVFVPVCLSIWGVLVFLRFPWVVGQAGLVGTIALFTTGYFMTGTTTLSLSAISTNGQVRGGGAYYMISRCLGPEFGGSIGIVFFLGTILTGALNLLGFVEPLLASFGESNGAMGTILPEGRWWQLLYATCASLVCLGLCLVGSSVVARASVFLACILLISTASIMASLAFREPFEKPAMDIVFKGFNGETLLDNLWPKFSLDMDVQQNFRTVFAIVFPACTGVLAGASMSGDLKSPSRAIPRGTIWAVGSTYVAYLSLAVLVAGSIERTTLLKDLSVLQDISLFPSLVAVGVAATSFFSALGSMIGAAKILQAIGKDDLLPAVSFFQHGKPPNNEPLRGILLTFGFMQAVLLFVTDINEIAPFVTMFSLLTFGVLNLACLLLRASGSPNFRPTFELFNWRTAFAGFAGCLIAMFVVDDLHALYSCLLAAIVFAMIHYYAPPKTWGDVTQSLIYHQSRKYLLRLDLRKEHVKFWRPQVMVLVQDPRQDFLLIKFLNDLKKGGLFVLGHILKGDFASRLPDYKRQLPAWLRYVDIAKVKAFVQLTISPSERVGAQNLLLGSGLGGMKPNIVVLGFLEPNRRRSPNFLESDDDDLADRDDTGGIASMWTRPNPRQTTADQVEELEQDPLAADLPNAIDLDDGIAESEYVGIIEDALGLNKAVGIARGFEALEQEPGEFRPSQTPSTNAARRFTAYAAEEYKRLSLFVTNRLTQRPPDFSTMLANQGETSPLLGAHPGSDAGDDLEIAAPQRRYIDLWPIQMAQTGLAKSAYTFDSYTLVLQLGTILYMVPYWKQNYILRTMIFVENEEEAEDERTRPIVPTNVNLAMKAEIKMVWLRPRYGKSDSQEYERICRRLHMQSSPRSVREVNDTGAGESSQETPKRRSVLMSTRLSAQYVNGWEFSEAVDDEQSDETSPIADSPSRRSGVPSVFDSLPTRTQHIVLNQLLLRHSSHASTAVILMTLPAPETGTGNSREKSMHYLENLDLLTKDLPPTFMVHGKGLTVTMSL
ncbi:hypothetical protein SpCBS45565_g02294 [Spizellomyces sp. 'palustris']|nr:hypothetical protein SpCBS45565_g02294 [Spizellomyces sp. 'palustris']